MVDNKKEKLGLTTNLLATVAGADKDILIKCPASDKAYISLIGFMLLLASGVLFAIAYGAVLSAKIGSSEFEILYLGIVCAAVALTVLAIDRAFIMADWFSYSSQKPEGGLLSPTSSDRSKRFSAITVRILLSVAIAFVFSTLAETYIYRDDINQIIEDRHIKTNSEIYAIRDEYTRQLDEEIVTSQKKLEELELAVRKATIDQLAISQADLEENIIVSNLRQQISENNARIQKLINLRDVELDKEKEQLNLAEQEQYGDKGETTTGKALSGVTGCGTNCNRAKDNALEAKNEATRLEEEIKKLESARDADLLNIKAAESSTIAQRADKIAISENTLSSAIEDRDNERVRLEKLQSNYQINLAQRTEFLEMQPGFIPKSEGLAARFQALHIVYDTYGIIREVIALKLFIIMLEMAPFLIKVLASPRTFYAVELNKKIAKLSYESESERLIRNTEFLENDYKAFQARKDWERRAKEDSLADKVYEKAKGTV